MKIPSLLTDLGMGLLAYLLVAKEMGRKRGLLAASLVLFNPVIFYNSAIWGQTDSLNNFFFLLSLFFVYRKNILLSMLFFAASLYVKLSLLPLLPFYLVFLFFITKKDLKKILIGIVLCVAAVLIATFPISANPVSWLLQEFPVIVWGGLSNITFAAFNFWWMVFCYPAAGHVNIPLVSQNFLSITLKTWAYFLFAVFSLPFLYLIIKKPKIFISKRIVFLTLSLLALLGFLFLPGMRDRYMYPVFPLLAIAIALSKQPRTYLIIFCLLTLFNLINVIYSWFPIVFNSTSNFYHFFYGDTFGWIISILTVVVAAWFYWKSFTDLRKVKM
jgi:Gpi18-like mannosyltransferase